MATSDIRIKTGATFSVPFTVVLPAGTWTADCDIRKADYTMVGSPNVILSALTEPDASGNTHVGLIDASGNQTKLWATGTMQSDVRFSDTSNPPIVILSDGFSITIERGVTID